MKFHYLPFTFDATKYDYFRSKPKKSRCLLMQSNKASKVAGELYSLRREIIRYYEKRGDELLDLYGYGWNSPDTQHLGPSEPFYTPIYKGLAGDKWETFAEYEFIFCIQNAIPAGDYECDIFMAIVTGAVPIYLPPLDADAYIPRDVYINYNDFRNLDELTAYVKSIIGTPVYEEYRRKGWEFINSAKFRPFTVQQFSEDVDAAIRAFSRQRTERFYQLYDFAKVKISQSNLDLITGYAHYLRHFQTEIELDHPDYEVKEFSEFVLPADHNYVGESFGFKDGACFPKEKYAVTITPDKITEYTTYPNRATNLWLQLLLLRQGKSLIHGAGVELNGQGVVFPAYGGTGKTTLISELRRLPNCRVFGDDYVIVDKNSRMFAYPSDFSVYPYHLAIFPELRSSEFSRYLSGRQIFSWYYFMKKAINFIWRRLGQSGTPLFSGWTAEYVKVPAATLLGENKIGGEVKLTTVVFLSRYSGREIKVAEISLDQLIQLTDGILWLESQYAMPYLETLAASGAVDLAGIVSSQREVLRSCFAPLKLLQISIPRKMEPTALGQYVAQLFKTNLS